MDRSAPQADTAAPQGSGLRLISLGRQQCPTRLEPTPEVVRNHPKCPNSTRSHSLIERGPADAPPVSDATPVGNRCVGSGRASVLSRTGVGPAPGLVSPDATRELLPSEVLPAASATARPAVASAATVWAGHQESPPLCSIAHHHSSAVASMHSLFRLWRPRSWLRTPSSPVISASTSLKRLLTRTSVWPQGQRPRSRTSSSSLMSARRSPMWCASLMNRNRSAASSS